jgi:hypothetical protein
MSDVVYVVELRKDGSLGSVPKIYKLVFREPGRQRDDAIARTYRALKRDLPDENPMYWKVARIL